MRIEELLVEYRVPQGDVDEDWKNWVAGMGAAATMAGVGGGVAYDQAKSKAVPQSAAQSQQAQAPKAKVAAPVAQNKAVSPEQVEQAKKALSDPDAQLLTKVAQSAGIKGTELAQFLAQCAHESANFSTTKEFGDKNYFKKYDIKFNPAKAKELGNLRPGDGELYKGRGYIQLTGKYNYEKAGKALGIDLVKKPALAEKPEIAAKIAVWFWKNRVQPNVDNFNNTAQATKPINAGLKGLQDRHDKFAGMKVAIAKPATLTKTAAKAPVAKVAAKPAAKPVKVAAVQKPKRST
jgi:putative chitinase